MNHPIQRSYLAAALSLLACLGPGCMSLEHVLTPSEKLQMYGGTKASYEYIVDETAPFFGTLMRVVDLPVTAVFDTVLLPVSAPVELIRGND